MQIKHSVNTHTGRKFLGSLERHKKLGQALEMITLEMNCNFPFLREHMLLQFSLPGLTRAWPLASFFTLIDLADWIGFEIPMTMLFFQHLHSHLLLFLQPKQFRAMSSLIIIQLFILPGN